MKMALTGATGFIGSHLQTEGVTYVVGYRAGAAV